MPNNITNKILFDAARAEEIFDAVYPDGKLDFDLLVPSPPNKYLGNLGCEEERDFPINWNSWNRINWGTKWNCYEQECGIDEGGKAYIVFDTAWSVPYPVLVAFANRFNQPFEHRYMEEYGESWGIERWDRQGIHGEHAFVHRVFKSKNNPKDKARLLIELKNYDPLELK